MRFRTLLAATLLAGVAPLPLMAAEAPVRSVTLSSGGLAEIVRVTPADGAASISLSVPADQVDDVLKSLVVRDPVGTVSSLTLDGPEQAEETFRNLPFSAEDLRSLPTLVGALQGTRVRASSGGKTVEGLALGVAPSDAGTDNGTLDVLTVLTDGGSADTLPLGRDARVEFLDPEVLRKIGDAVAVAGRAKSEGSRAVTLSVDGEGMRDVAVSYVVAAPIWKTAYRVVASMDGKARLQAWAVLENASGEDWEDVAVTLSSGSPVTLRQRLHQRYWRDRPEVPIDVGQPEVPVADGSRENIGAMAMRAAPAPMAAPPMVAEMAWADAKVSAPSEAAVTAEGDVTATYALPTPVDLKAGGTLSVPIVDAEIDARRVSVFQPRCGGRHPVAAMMLENGTGTSLPPGILTVYDERDGYVGDAQLLGVPVGEARLASFATDRKVEIDTETGLIAEVTTIAVADGVASVSSISRETTSYTVQGAVDGSRTVVIEHPRREGWTFRSDSLRGTTGDAHRLEIELGAGATTTVEAVDEIVRVDAYGLADVDTSLLSHWASGQVDEETRGKIETLARARADATRAERDLSMIDEEAGRIRADQERVRENLKAVPPQSELAARYLRDMDGQEAHLAELSDRRVAAERRVRDYRESVGEIIRTF